MQLVMYVFSCVIPAAQAVAVPLALQRLFYTLSATGTTGPAASTVELTDSFGWSKAQARQQHDIQELLRVLFDHLGASAAHFRDVSSPVSWNPCR